MPSLLYFFIVEGPSRCYDDEAGTLLQDDRAALRMAERVISELKSAGDDGYRDHVMIVKDASGRTVFSIPF
jgi:hypothetical protein